MQSWRAAMAADCRIGLYQGQGPASPFAARLLAPLRAAPRLEVGSIASQMAAPLFDASETPWTPAARARHGTQLHWNGLVVHVVDHRLPVLEVVQEAVEVVLLSCHGE